MDGIIILDKSSNVFSRTAGWHVAKMFGEKKFGHIGTLDPMATGVLPIAIGNATKMIPFVEENTPNKSALRLTQPIFSFLELVHLMALRGLSKNVLIEKLRLVLTVLIMFRYKKIRTMTSYHR